MDPTTTTPATAPEAGAEEVDVSLIRWMLSLAPEERLAVLQGFVDSVLELAPEADATTAT